MHGGWGLTLLQRSGWCILQPQLPEQLQQYVFITLISEIISKQDINPFIKNFGTVVGIHSVGVVWVSASQRIPLSVLVRNPHKVLDEISYKIGRRQRKARSQNSQQIGVSDSQGKLTVRERWLLKQGVGTCEPRSQVS